MKVPHPTAPAYVPPVQTRGVLQRACACGQHTHGGGECANCQQKRVKTLPRTSIVGDPPNHLANNVLQTKLAINRVGDEYEQEANRIADHILAAPEYPVANDAPLHIQRFAGQSTWQTDIAPASVDHVLASPGMPLDSVLQQDMEQRFGYDFSQVRVHSDSAAAQSAQEVNARAYTVGHNIVFGAHQFTRGTHEGRHLIAHELAHVVQQTGPGETRPDQSGEKRGRYPATVPLLREQPTRLARQELNSDNIAPLSTGPECSKSKNRGQDLPLASTSFAGEKGFANIPKDGHPGPGGLLVRGDSVQIKISAQWEEQIPDPSQRPPDQQGRKADSPKYFLTFSGWVDDCSVTQAGTQASSPKTGNLAIATEHTISLKNLIPGRYGLAIAPSTASPEPNRVLKGQCEVT